MEKRDFAMLENMCQFRFREAGSCFHVCTQENLPVIFHGEQEMKIAMNIVAFIAFMFPEIKIFTFEVMVNHFHLVVAGQEFRVESFAMALIKKLAFHPELKRSRDIILKMAPKLHPIDSLNNFRNVIAYTNRNGTVINPDENPFSYKWGANRYFFNNEAKLRYTQCGHTATQEEKRTLTRSHRLDNVRDIIVLDGYISPLCYCRVQEAESIFFNNRQYFYLISKNIESQKEIAELIGESIFYTDYDLFNIIASVCRKDYGGRNSSELKPEEKMSIARTLHYEYNAGNKQISRLLKIPVEAISSMFPR